MRSVLLIPGIDDSGPTHWQTLWQQQHPGVRRIAQRDWHAPRCVDWVQGIADALAREPAPVLLVAHSLGCLALLHWLAQAGSDARRQMHAALLVAVPDPAGPAFPARAQGFGPLPSPVAGLPLTLVASENDPFSSPAYAQALARAWQAEWLMLGPLGHLNADSGLADWPWAWQWVQARREAGT